MKVKLFILGSAVLLLAACAQDSGAPAVAGSSAESAAPASTDAVAVAQSVVAGDPEMGKRQFIYCQACHSINAGGPNKVGPNLHGVLDSAAAQAGGFVYSAALTDAGLTWDVATLDRWIEAPTALVPGTTMVFAGIKDAQQRANLIAYMQATTSE